MKKPLVKLLHVKRLIANWRQKVIGILAQWPHCCQNCQSFHNIVSINSAQLNRLEWAAETLAKIGMLDMEYPMPMKDFKRFLLVKSSNSIWFFTKCLTCVKFLWVRWPNYCVDWYEWEFVKQPARHIIASLLIMIHMVIAMAPLALQSSSAIQSLLKGNPSKDCITCNCSSGCRGGPTCCCCQKKLVQKHDQDCQPLQGTTCCDKKLPQRKTALFCNCPCGNGKQLTFSSIFKYEAVPYYFIDQKCFSHVSLLNHDPPLGLISRHSEPPDPPPKA